MRGGFAGGQVGVNLQRSMFVVGVEADGSWAWIAGNHGCTTPFNPGYGCNTDVNSFATFRGRVGLAINNILLYATGGYALTLVERHDTGPGAVQPSISVKKTVGGYAVGAGAEYGFGPWSVKAEWLYINPMAAVYLAPAGPGLFAKLRVDPSYNIVCVGLNYRFLPMAQ
jgi:outer membrane immunogenic protein